MPKETFSTTTVALTVVSSPVSLKICPIGIMSEVLASPTKERSYQIPTDSFDQVLIQTYQAAIDNEGKVLGFWETIYDLKQPLKTYLDNSAQALVAWSDATSGASFKEETDF